jgi:hypothetical protein
MEGRTSGGGSVRILCLAPKEINKKCHIPSYNTLRIFRVTSAGETVSLNNLRIAQLDRYSRECVVSEIEST